MNTTFPKSPPKEIEREIQTLQRDYTAIMENEGKFVLIQGDSVVAYFDSYTEAINEGYKRFGLDNFLVRQVRTHEDPIRAMRCGVIETDGRLRLSRAKRR
jgi:hypothetical protein